jgi:hypothetical protein
MPAIFNPDAGFISPVFYDKCVITSGNDTTDRVMTGGAAGGVVPWQDTLPQLTATVYLRGQVVSPQPEILWEVDSDACSIDQSGNIQRRRNPAVAGFDSNGCSVTEHTGQLVQVTATVLRQDGSKSGVLGTLNVAIQNHAPRQGYNGAGKPANSPTGTSNYYNLVATSQPPTDQSA